MADEDPPAQPTQPIHTAASVDTGLASWANLVRDQIAMQSGVELMATTGGSFRFRFRGQEFAVTVIRTS